MEKCNKSSACKEQGRRGGWLPQKTLQRFFMLHALPKGTAHLHLCFLAGESLCSRDTGKGKTTATRSKDSHLRDFYSAIPDLEASNVKSEPGRAMCESPSDLPLTGKVLAATMWAVDPAICRRRGVAVWLPSWQRDRWLAGP